MKYALIMNATEIAPGIYTGRVYSRHRTLSGMANALERAQRPTRNTSGGMHLDIQPIEVEAGTGSRGRIVKGDAWTAAQWEASNR